MLAASICFSTGGLLIKLVPWNPLAINGARNLIACMVIGPFDALYLYIKAGKRRDALKKQREEQESGKQKERLRRT